MQLGIDLFAEKADRFRSANIGFVTNNSAVNSRFELSRLALLAQGFTIKRLFSPEHGLTAQAPDGEAQAASWDILTEIPVVSLYGDKLAPEEEDFEGLDCIVFDIPEVGCRFYTYQWTLLHVMQACAKFGMPLVVLDRPNVLGGNFAHNEGPMLEEENFSFCGLRSIPIRHGCTIGELARYWTAELKSDLDLTVIAVEGWDRNRDIQTQDFKFVPTSPGMPDLHTAFLYPGMGLLEGVNLSEGRGTTLPFKIFGAPWIDGGELISALKERSDATVRLIPYSYVPVWGRYAGERCHGAMIADFDRENFRPVTWVLELFRTLQRLYPSAFRSEIYPTAANPTGTRHLEILSGISDIWSVLKSTEDDAVRKRTLENPEVRQWEAAIQPFLLY